MTRTFVECHDLTYYNEWICSDDIKDTQIYNVQISGVIVEETKDVLKISCLYAPDTKRSGYLVVVPKRSIVFRKDFNDA